MRAGSITFTTLCSVRGLFFFFQGAPSFVLFRVVGCACLLADATRRRNSKHRCWSRRHGLVSISANNFSQQLPCLFAPSRIPLSFVSSNYLADDRAGGPPAVGLLPCPGLYVETNPTADPTGRSSCNHAVAVADFALRVLESQPNDCTKSTRRAVRCGEVQVRRTSLPFV